MRLISELLNARNKIHDLEQLVNRFRRQSRQKSAPGRKRGRKEGSAQKPDGFPLSHAHIKGLRAHLIAGKYANHLPLNCEIDIFKRSDFQLSSSTVSDWHMAAAQVLKPLYNVLRIHLQKCDYGLADAPLPVLKSEKSGSLHRGYMWAFYNTEETYPFFEYHKGRGYSRADTFFPPDVKVDTGINDFLLRSCFVYMFYGRLATKCLIFHCRFNLFTKFASK